MRASCCPPLTWITARRTICSMVWVRSWRWAVSPSLGADADSRVLSKVWFCEVSCPLSLVPASSLTTLLPTSSPGAMSPFKGLFFSTWASLINFDTGEESPASPGTISWPLISLVPALPSAAARISWFGSRTGAELRPSLGPLGFWTEGSALIAWAIKCRNRFNPVVISLPGFWSFDSIVPSNCFKAVKLSRALSAGPDMFSIAPPAPDSDIPSPDETFTPNSSSSAISWFKSAASWVSSFRAASSLPSRDINSFRLSSPAGSSSRTWSSTGHRSVFSDRSAAVETDCRDPSDGLRSRDTIHRVVKKVSCSASLKESGDSAFESGSAGPEPALSHWKEEGNCWDSAGEKNKSVVILGISSNRNN